ncbi:MAG TPA: hypothetical protein VHR66_22040 [Gemmataceae bacterium]|jgi:hypothetical protein|nr:hypothetical protein [Gemmataceae bacterium]
MSKKAAYLFASAAFLGGFLFAEFGAPLVFAEDAKGPKWTHGLMLRARKGDEPDFSKDTKKFGVEVFVDENNGNLIYISETGSISVVKK